MRYRNNASSNTIRIIIAKFAGKCACCGGAIPAGAMVDYWPTRRSIAHHKGWNGDSVTCYNVQCTEMERQGLPTSRKPNPDFIDIDRAYEDQCADICGR